jgi:hypothetical protein
MHGIGTQINRAKGEIQKLEVMMERVEIVKMLQLKIRTGCWGGRLARSIVSLVYPSALLEHV